MKSIAGCRVVMGGVLVFGLAGSAVLSGCSGRNRAPLALVATIETQPVASLEDAADDPAIWINRANPAQSRVLGTDKQSGLAVYDLEGNQVQFARVGRVNNVDVREGLTLAGLSMTVAAASQRDQRAILVWTINSEGVLSDPPIATILTGLSEPYGLCLARADRDRLYCFVNDKDGRIEQWLLGDDGTGTIRGELLRTLRVPTQPEGMVADEGQGFVFVGEEGAGVWRFPLHPVDGSDGQLIAFIKPRGELTPDVEGLAIVPKPTRQEPNAGYLLVSSQGSNQFAAYDRTPPHAFLGIWSVRASASIDAVQETDGIDATNTPLGPLFPFGVFVAQDGDNAPQPQNFKLVPWEQFEALIARPIR